LGVIDRRLRFDLVTTAVRTLLKMTAATADTVRPPAAGLVVLIYHRVGRRTPIDVDLPLDLFQEQVCFLAEQCRVVTLDEGLHEITTSEGARDSMVAVSFDDGTADFGDLALPVLVEHGVPVTLFLATRFVEEGVPFPDGGVPLSWGSLADALSTGLVEVGSHTHGHALLDRVPIDRARHELDRSAELISDRLGKTPAHFAYPKAILGSPEVELAVRERFRSAALAGTRPNPFAVTDPYRLARSPVQVNDGLRWFARKARGGLMLEDSVRRLVNRRRFRGLTT
jgi:peptidoglycan/xylan/chitin deacetylase (PgdA/CDA1 family)